MTDRPYVPPRLVGAFLRAADKLGELRTWAADARDSIVDNAPTWKADAIEHAETLDRERSKWLADRAGMQDAVRCAVTAREKAIEQRARTEARCTDLAMSNRTLESERAEARATANARAEECDREKARADAEHERAEYACNEASDTRRDHLACIDECYAATVARDREKARADKAEAAHEIGIEDRLRIDAHRKELLVALEAERGKLEAIRTEVTSAALDLECALTGTENMRVAWAARLRAALEASK